MVYEFFWSSVLTFGEGGLFDFNATLPLLVIQFLILMFILNIILYNPLLSVINERNDYIVSNLAKSADLLAEVNTIKEAYESEVLEARKAGQVELTRFQKECKELFDAELELSQKEYDAILERLTNRLSEEKASALTTLEKEIESISEQILGKIFA